jgi:hypothetical protein
VRDRWRSAKRRLQVGGRAISSSDPGTEFQGVDRTFACRLEGRQFVRDLYFCDALNSRRSAPARCSPHARNNQCGLQPRPGGDSPALGHDLDRVAFVPYNKFDGAVDRRRGSQDQTCRRLIDIATALDAIRSVDFDDVQPPKGPSRQTSTSPDAGRWISRRGRGEEEVSGHQRSPGRKACRHQAVHGRTSCTSRSVCGDAQLHRPTRTRQAFEVLLTELFLLFDMEPRLSYNLPHEQIDGSLSFDTDDYIVEARWRQQPTGREHLDVFRRKSSERAGTRWASSSA